ncbi:hypothetical protein BX666DRAFT_556828 [Dichotomocladium elegans]|nr:hypothetical protein BX666DRAFT_556828 [Dichotomocladium elegans]
MSIISSARPLNLCLYIISIHPFIDLSLSLSFPIPNTFLCISNITMIIFFFSFLYPYADDLSASFKKKKRTRMIFLGEEGRRNSKKG